MFGRNRFVAVGLALALILPVAVAASGKKLKKIKPGANPPQYRAFAKPLSRDEQSQHALERLTFGPRPGDLAALKRTGLDAWLDLELHPERLPENPILEQRLAP